MNKNRNFLDLPQQCYAVLPYDGRLVFITQGKPGYASSSLDRGDRQKNRLIADEKNKELGGITPEQEKRMLTGAIFGWEFTGMSATDPIKPGKILELEISRPGDGRNVNI